MEGTRASEQAKQQSQQALQQTQQKATQAADQVRQKAKSQLATQKERAAGTLESVAQALHQTGQQLREQDQGSIGQYADEAADRVERFSGHLRERNVDQLVGQAEDFARRQPALFVGGAFALGLLGARFLKSSSQGEGYSSEGRASTRGTPTPTTGERAPYGIQEAPYAVEEEYAPVGRRGVEGQAPRRPLTDREGELLEERERNLTRRPQGFEEK